MKSNWKVILITVLVIALLSVLLALLAFSFTQSVKLGLLEERWKNLVEETDSWCDLTNYFEILESHHEKKTMGGCIDLMIPYFVMIRNRNHSYAGIYTPELQLLSDHKYSLASLGFSPFDYPDLVGAVCSMPSGSVTIDVSFLLEGKMGKFYHIYFREVVLPDTKESVIVMAGLPFDFQFVELPARIYRLVYLSFGVFGLELAFIIYFIYHLFVKNFGRKS